MSRRNGNLQIGYRRGSACGWEPSQIGPAITICRRMVNSTEQVYSVLRIASCNKARWVASHGSPRDPLGDARAQSAGWTFQHPSRDHREQSAFKSFLCSCRNPFSSSLARASAIERHLSAAEACMSVLELWESPPLGSRDSVVGAGLAVCYAQKRQSRTG